MGNAEEKGARFAALHESGCFLLPNPWDMGSARLLAALGAQAFGTSSAAYGFTRGLPDGVGVSREEAIAHAAEIDRATALPVSADLEDGFGAAPGLVAETVRLAAEAGIAGCSIEDIPQQEPGEAYPFDLAVERVRAGAEAARAAGRPFVFTARADGLWRGVYDIEEAIRRLKAFEGVGADALYAPLPPDLAAQARICASVTKPVNALAAGALMSEDVAALAAAGVRRISLGSTLARKTYRVIVDAGLAMFGEGRLDVLKGGAGAKEIDPLLVKGAGSA